MAKAYGAQCENREEPPPLCVPLRGWACFRKAATVSPREPFLQPQPVLSGQWFCQSGPAQHRPASGVVPYPTGNKSEQVANRPHRCFLFQRSTPGRRVRRRGNMKMSTRGRYGPSGNDIGRLLHDQVILYGFDPFDAPCDVTSFIDGILGINEAAQLDNALESLDADLE